jgi:hypothetical protein
MTGMDRFEFARRHICTRMAKGKQTPADIREMLHRWARGELKCGRGCPVYTDTGRLEFFCEALGEHDIDLLGSPCFCDMETWSEFSMAVVLLGEGV